MTDADVARLVPAIVLYGVMPLWMLSGFADWLCHRRSRIEHTSGLRESALHLLLLLEMGPATLLAAFFEINALVVLVMLGAFALHQATIYVDLRYSSARRDIPPVEQMVHSLLEYVPVVGAALILVLHWPAVLSLFGLGPAPADFALRWRGSPLSPLELVVFATALIALVILPYTEEAVRCWRAARARAGAAAAV